MRKIRGEKRMAKNETVAVESQYDIEELVAAAKVFKATPDLVRTALKLGGKTLYTQAEAEKIVSEFRSKKIK